MAVIGANLLRASLRRLVPEVNTRLKRAIQVSALDLDREMKRSIQQGPKTGRIYKRGRGIRRGRRGGGLDIFHQASAPGEPPATDTGRLVSSISAQFADDGLTATIGVHEISRVRYARFLEFGTRKMRARPFVRRAYALKKNEINERLRKAVENGLRAARRR